MAILGKIRKRSGLAVIFVGVAITAFVLGDIGKSTWSSPVNVGEIAGEKITYADFESKVEENMYFAKQNASKDNLTSEEVFSVRQNTWTQMVSDIIMKKAYDETGVTISAEEMTDLIQGPTPHKYIVQNFSSPETGQLNRELLINFLQTLDQREPEVQKQMQSLIEAIRAERINTKYNNMVGKAFYMPTALTQKDYQLKNIKASFRFVAQSFTLIPDSLVSFTDKDLKAYFEKNKQNYEQEETRDFDYVIFDVLPSEQDRMAAEKEINRLYAELEKANDIASFVNFNSEERYDSSFKKRESLPLQIDSVMFNSPVGTMAGPWLDNNIYYFARLMDVQTRPDSLKASHILIAYKGAFGSDEKVTRTKEAAKKTADSLASALRADKKKFADLATRFSNDPSVTTNQGDLGWFADGQMVYPFNKAVIEGKTGEITSAESAFGYHVIHVTGKTTPIKKTRVAIVKLSITPSTRTQQEIYATASAFAGQNRTQEAFEKAVAEQGLNKRTKDYTNPMDMGLPGLDNSRQVINWVFNPRVKPGDVSDVKELENKFVVAVLKKIRPKGITPLEDIRQAIEASVKKEKKIELLANRMKEAGTKDLLELAQKLNARVDTASDITFFTYNIPGLGREPSFVGDLFSLNPNETSDPIKGLNNAIVVRVNSFSDAPAKTDFSFERKQLENNFVARSSSAIFKALEKLAKIEDNRVMFF
jgi:peptidyl-prolyl cis-trans isomerase D